MRYTEVLIAGGGLAGSVAAAMLGRAGVDAVLVDPHDVYPPDFLDGLQVALLERTGLAGPVLSAATRDDDVWIGRFGRLVEKRPNRQYNLLYDTMVNAVRAQIPRSVPFIRGKVASIVTSNDRQKITLSSGEEFSARLVVIANGLNIGLRHALGMTRDIISEGHSISIGFDLRPAGRKSFDFRALTYYADRTSDQIAYLALFTIGSTMRANFFVYRDMHDPWLRQLRQSPQPTMFAAMRGLRKLTGDFEVTDRMTIRPVDLYVTKGYEQPGVVLVGDAFGTSCPAAGTGSNKLRHRPPYSGR